MLFATTPNMYQLIFSHNAKSRDVILELGLTILSSCFKMKKSLYLVCLIQTYINSYTDICKLDANMSSCALNKQKFDYYYYDDDGD